MHQDSDDKSLLGKIARKDEAAFKALYERYHERIYRFVIGRVRDAGLAEDVTMETFWDIWRGADRYSGGAKVSTWMFAIARNKSVSALRKRHDLPMDMDAAPEIEDHDDTPEISAQKNSKAEALQICIAKLPAKHREIIDLVYYQEMAIKDVSAILEIPENTVKTRMFHARQQLSTHLQRAGLDSNWP